MLTIAETSGLIAAAVVIVQYLLPAAIAVILVKRAGNNNTAVTWSVINRYISTTVWPHLLRSDAVSSRHVSTSTSVLTWTATIGALLLVLASVLAPLGLSEKILPGEFELVGFEYAKDPSPWGQVTMPRPNFKFSRQCEVGLAINCPGQYQGVYMNETEAGTWESVESDEDSTVNTTIPRNYTTMFRSATSDQGNTISGMFDIQYRLWGIVRDGIIDKGQPFVRGKSRHVESLIQQDKILLKEGLIIDMRDGPGIGFRNHTIPIGLSHGGLWSEDITWVEPVTQCADTNISAELRIEESVESFTTNQTMTLVDRGAFANLQNSDVESRPWIDNQTLDLFAHAYKAARMHNVLVASSLGITLPLNGSTKVLPPRPITTGVFSPTDFVALKMSELEGIGGADPQVPGYDFSNSSFSSNTSTSRPTAFVPEYPDGMVKLLALNYSAIEQICAGYYRVAAVGLDTRANNITYPAIQCGALLGAPVEITPESLSASMFTGVRTARKNVYICATAYKASIKSVDFRYNGTGQDLTRLEVLKIAPKTYPSANAKPLWAVEHSFERRMRFDPLWGLVNASYEVQEAFHTLRSESLWLPTSPSMTLGFGETEGYDALAATGGFLKRLSNLYKPWLGKRDYSGSMEFALSERWSELSRNQTGASQIPSLILTDGLAAGLVGTKTSFSSKIVEWPASLAVDNKTRGFPRNKVQTYRRVIQYDIRYAIPSFVILALLLVALAGAIISATITPSILRTMQRMYNQTSPGRLATSLLLSGESDPTQTSDSWTENQGRLNLVFGQFAAPEDETFCKIVEVDRSDGEPQSVTVTEAAKAERHHLLPGTAR